ncbi:acyltransferase family protein [Dactylosporangium sp. CS-033363]|uniref:acyltransferase family protein n=1 Tax=Dactylosporangium sp. CS-033363 TaxID=3239935 RepID=UPI003D944A62
MSAVVPESAAQLAAATPDRRDRYVDLIRVVSICAVIVGHWLLAMVTLYGAGELPFRLPFQIITWVLQVMPLFFAVGGFAHSMTLASLRRKGGSLGDFYRSRTARLLPPVLVLLGVWAVLAGVLEAGGWEQGPVGLAVDRVTTPLWFIGVYLMVVLFAPLMEFAHRRLGWGVLALLAVLAIGFDLLEFRYGQLWAGVVNLVIIWLAIHQLGFFWADGVLSRGWIPAVCAVVGIGAAVAVTYGAHWYPVLMVGLPGSPASNMAPPNMALFAYAIGQIGLVLLVCAPAERWLRRARVWLTVVYGNGVVMTLFCWHLSAVFVVQGVLLLVGVKPPAAGTGGWWAILPLWILACAVPLAGLVALFRRAERIPGPSAGGGGAVIAALGVVLAGVGIFVVSQVGFDGLFLGKPEEVNGVTLAAWMGVAGLLAGLVLLRIGGGRAANA